MSHFTVLVIGENVDEQLAPFQEGDCPEEYMAFEDKEDEYLEQYQTEKIEMVRSPEGELFTLWDERFREGDFFDRKTVIPENYEKVEVPHRKRFATFEEFCESWHGSERDEKTGRFGYWHNPNAKWDWYEIGGRWTGFFKLKKKPLLGNGKINFDEFGFSEAEFMNLVNMYQKDKEKYLKAVGKYGAGKAADITKKIDSFIETIYPEHLVGRPGLCTAPAAAGHADQVRKRDIDLQGMREEAARKAGEAWDTVNTAIAGTTSDFMSWDAIRAKHGDENIDAAREEYHAQSTVMAFKKLEFGIFSSVEDYLVPREKFVTEAWNDAISTHSVLKDGEWTEKGEMGWFGFSDDKMSEEEWAACFNKMLDELPDDTLLTVVDCHI